MTRPARNLAPPPRAGLVNEAFAGLEFGRLAFGWPRLLQLPRGKGERVMVLPGYGADDLSTVALRAYLRAMGYVATGWGLGRNDGDVSRLMGQVAARVRELTERDQAPVRLIGWSLGGYLAREAARDLPQRVARVVTLGSPVVGGPKYTAVARLFGTNPNVLDLIERLVDQRYAVPLTVPVTAIYSKRDGVVAWQACIDERSPAVEHVEVRTTHIGLGFAPEVYEIVARRLAAAAGRRDAA
jgi:pimeloyl-ACP methyl ester carboxylesterase